MRITVTPLLVTGTLACITAAVTAQQIHSRLSTVEPVTETMGRHTGRLQGQVSLRRVVRPDLRPACDALVAGRMVAAERGFRSALADDPDDYAARVGLIQATYATHEQQVRDLLIRRSRPGWSRYDRFTLGVLRLYQYSDRQYGVQLRSLLVNQPLRTESSHLLRDLFLETRDPVVGLLLCEARNGARDHSYFAPLFKSLLKPSAWHAFERARSGGWQGDPPSTAGMALSRLAILERVCCFSACDQGGWDTSYRPVMRDGHYVMVTTSGPSPGCSQVAYAWLRRWQSQLQRQMAAAPED